MDDSNEKSSPSTSNIVPSSHNTINSLSINILSGNSYNLNEGRILENNNENSHCDKDLNEKIIKLLIGDHPLLPIKTIEKIAYCNFMNQHYKNKDFYNIKVIDEIIHNESSHIVAEFKDYLIKGDISEFLQQYYKKKESLNLLPKIYEYYISCSVIFPNYVILPESQYIYKNIQRKQRVIDIQQEQEDKEENVKNGLIEQEKEPTIFNTQAFDSILNQTDTSGAKLYFGLSTEVSKGCGDQEMLKLVNNIDNAEKKINLNTNNKKNRINVCKLKKGKNNEIFQFQNNLILNEGGYSKKIQNSLHYKKNYAFYEKKSSGNYNYNNEHHKLLNKNNLKQILRQSTEINNNFYKKRNTFSTQITYIDSRSKRMKNAFDLKGIESIKKLKKNSKYSKESKTEKESGKYLHKNNSQTFSSLKNINSKEKNYIKEKEKENKDNNINHNKDFSQNYSMNQSDVKNINNEKNNNINQHQYKEIISRNNELYKIENNIKTYFQEPFNHLAQGKNTITSYKTKSQNKHKTKGYQTSRNKYDNKNMFINVSKSKSNLSKNHQSIDSEINNNSRKKTINHIQSKHNNLKNNLINALLGSGNNNQKNKITKYKDILIQKDNDSFVNSIEINKKENKINNDININKNEKINFDNNEKENDNSYNNNENRQEFNDNINNAFIYNNNDKNNSHNKRVISGSNLDSNNNKVSSTSCTKTMSINSYGTKPRYSCSSINTINHKKQISMSKIPTSFPENRILNKNKKNNNKNIIDDIDNKNKLKEFIDNYLDDYFSSKINNFNNTQSKNFNQEEFNNNVNNFFIEGKNKSKIKNKNEVLSIKNLHEKKKEKDENAKIRNSIFNFEKRISKKLSEKNINIFNKFKKKNSPKNANSKKTSSVRTNKSGNIHNSECGPLSARESNSKYQINSEMIELLSNKIQKIKQSIKETSDKGSNSISSIFKKKKIPSAGRKTIVPGTKKSEEFIDKKTQNSKTRNKKNNNNFVGTTSSNSNIGISGSLVNTIINSIYQTNLLSPNKKNIEYEKLMKTFQKFKRPTNSFNGNNNSKNSKSNYNSNNNYNNIVNKKDCKNKKKHDRCNSIYNTNNNNGNNFNIEVNIKNNMRIQSKKSVNNVNDKNQNDNNLNSLNINFNNYTNNYNYNYNINSNNGNNAGNMNLINNNNINYNNSMINKGKSNSQKIIMGKVLNKNEINFKGIPINGFEKLITKKYNTRNYNIPMSVTDRIKQQNNFYSTSIASNNTNSNRYKNINIRHSNNRIGCQKK